MIEGAVDNPAMHRFEIDLGDGVAAAYYQIDGDRFVLTHTEVPSEHSGQGIASRLAKAVLEEIRRRGGKIAVRCPFFDAYLAKHPDYSDLIDG